MPNCHKIALLISFQDVTWGEGTIMQTESKQIRNILKTQIEPGDNEILLQHFTYFISLHNFVEWLVVRVKRVTLVFFAGVV